ncbi:MAG: HAMP domain-containing histidine kinase [Phycisphaerales bacterium]|nr:MAG: HAMP domain-containing histidine kinase [Phycisphaerales bacterium]
MTPGTNTSEWSETGDPKRRAGLLAGMRIRKKLIFLHTAFSLVLAGILILALRPAVRSVVEAAEQDESLVVMRALVPSVLREGWHDGVNLAVSMESVRVRHGSASELGLLPDQAAEIRARFGDAVIAPVADLGASAVSYVPGAREGDYVAIRVVIPAARRAVWLLYLLASLAVVAVYAFVAVALEVFVLPRNVYDPIRRLLAADRATREDRRTDEIIPAAVIPADELGEIMRSRNETIGILRKNQADLAAALEQLEVVAVDMKRRNHLLEMARRNLADADRLASLGMMSAGLAHELNTPLAVLTGLVEKLNGSPTKSLPAAEAALMGRVVHRLERLGESLLDFARVRPPRTSVVRMADIVEEAATLVRLDPDRRGVEIRNRVPLEVVVECDADRMVQVFVNLLRNSCDSVVAYEEGLLFRSEGGRLGSVEVRGRVGPQESVECEPDTRDAEWVTITVIDDGGGIDPAVLPRLFEPFASTRLDARGTGLGLAVAEGIVREHAGVILAKNRPPVGGGEHGAIFEILMPLRQRVEHEDDSTRASAHAGRS